MEVFWHTCQIGGIETSGEMQKGGLHGESKMTETATNRRDKFSNTIILSGQLAKHKCSPAPCGNDDFKKQTRAT